MKDYLGQEIKVGSKILWSGGKGEYSGFEQVFEVLEVGHMFVTFQRKKCSRKTRVYEGDVVVVDDLLPVKPKAEVKEVALPAARDLIEFSAAVRKKTDEKFRAKLTGRIKSAAEKGENWLYVDKDELLHRTELQTELTHLGYIVENPGNMVQMCIRW